MQFQLQQIVPHPLRERIAQRSSEVWGQMLTWHAGEKIQIIAPSGTGKTTLVHVLWNLRHDYSGQLYYKDTNVRQMDAVRLSGIRQQQLSVVFQDMRLFPKLTGRENIELKRMMSGEPYCSAHDVDEMAAQLGVQSILHQRAETCSYGEQQRIAIIRSLVQPFKWLIMDEPFSHLDKRNTDNASRLIMQACEKRGAGFILTDLDGNSTLSFSQTLNL